MKSVIYKRGKGRQQVTAQQTPKTFQEIIKIYDDTSFYKSPLNIGLNNMPFNQLGIVKKKEETVWAENGQHIQTT